ncbi:MAG: hypothetical protein H0X04_00015 [Chthoniobacterales bacterium]|nr:hypothetical protein [Chthoniobacterales bacterium]
MSTTIIPTTSSHPYFVILQGGPCDGMRSQHENRYQARKYGREAVDWGDCDGFTVRCVPRADRTTDA